MPKRKNIKKKEIVEQAVEEVSTVEVNTTEQYLKDIKDLLEQIKVLIEKMGSGF